MTHPTVLYCANGFGRLPRRIEAWAMSFTVRSGMRRRRVTRDASSTATIAEEYAGIASMSKPMARCAAIGRTDGRPAINQK